MTNLDKKSQKESIHLNMNNSTHSDLDSYWNFINEWLPKTYSSDVNKLLPIESQLEDTTYIRQVKREKINNPLIVNALYRHAQFHKKQLEALEEKI